MNKNFFSHQPLKFRSQNLDALRFLMALWVLLTHTISWAVYTNAIDSSHFLSLFNSGLRFLFQKHGETHPAVLIFIILSGYCIHRDGFRIKGESSFKSFFIRRSFRIFPIYWLAIILGFFFFHINSGMNLDLTQRLSGTQNIELPFIFSKILGVSSFLPSLHISSFQGNAPLATVMVEIWLYFFYAFIFWSVNRGIPFKNIMRFFGVIWAITLGYVLLNKEYYSWWHNGCFISFFPYWWFGAHLAEYARNKSFYSSKLIKIAFLVVVLGSFINVLLLIELKKMAFVYLMGAFLIKLDTSHANYFPWVSKLGHISYSLYAIHAPIVIYLLISGLSLLFSTFLVLSFSMICFWFIENPLLMYGKNLSKIRKI